VLEVDLIQYLVSITYVFLPVFLDILNFYFMKTAGFWFLTYKIHIKG